MTLAIAALAFSAATLLTSVVLDWRTRRKIRNLRP